MDLNVNPLAVPWGSSHGITATLTDREGNPVTGATVTLTVYDAGGMERQPATLMADEQDGTYTLNVTADVVRVRLQETLTYAVRAVNGAQERNARIPVTVTPDTD